MNMMERHHLLQSLIPATTAPVSTPSNATLSSRLAFVFFAALISIWANHEDSKGFAVTIVNEAGNTPAGNRFSLFYQSNDKAMRVILSTSKLVENLLYQHPSDDHHKKQVNRVVLRLRRNATTETAAVEVEHSDQTHHEFTLHLSPLIMEQPNFEFAVYSAVLRGMARVWIWDGHGRVPRLLVDAVVEYIGGRAGARFFDQSRGRGEIVRSDGTVGGLPEYGSTDCFNGENLTEFLDFCEREKPGFVRRLNAGMREMWEDGMMDDALGMPAQHLCSSFISSR